MDVYSDYLAHYGVKGQKWGIRRYQNEDGSYTDLGRRLRNKLGGSKEKREPPESSKWRAKDAGYLSDEELRKRITRLQQEKQYKEMTASRLTKTRKWVAKTAEAVLIGTAIAALKGAVKTKYEGFFDSKAALPLDATNIAKGSKKSFGEW